MRNLLVMFSLLVLFTFKDSHIVAAIEYEPAFLEKSLIEKRIDRFSEEDQKLLWTQAVEKQYILEIIKEQFENYDEFEKQTTVYLDEEGNIIIGIKDDRYNDLKGFIEKVEEIDTNNKIFFEKVENSTVDLILLRDEIVNEIETNGKVEYSQSIITNVDIENNSIIVSVEDITDFQTEEIKESITKHFPNRPSSSIVNLTKSNFPKSEKLTGIKNTRIMLDSHKDSDIPVNEISRARDWTKLGGGIRLHDFGGGNCTSAAVAQKGSNYFLLTAGHCLNANDSHVFQDSSILGRDHSIGSWNGTDVGLIRVTDESPLNERRATNHFYEYAEHLTDYDQRLTGVGVAWQGQLVCKSGITTGVTCGNISYYDTTYRPNNYNYTLSVSRIFPRNSIDYSRGGDSGSITYDPSTNVLYGIHSGGSDDEGFMTRIHDVINLYSGPTYAFKIYTSNTNVVIAR